MSTNAAIIVFTTETFDDWTDVGKYWIFFGFQAFCYSVQVSPT